MPRGAASPNGTTRVAQNGYHYTKVNGKWKLTHHIIAEKKYGRELEDGDRVIFKNGKRRDLRPENVIIVKKGGTTVARRLAQLEARKEELEARIRQLQQEQAHG